MEIATSFCSPVGCMGCGGCGTRTLSGDLTGLGTPETLTPDSAIGTSETATLLAPEMIGFWNGGVVGKPVVLTFAFGTADQLRNNPTAGTKGDHHEFNEYVKDAWREAMRMHSAASGVHFVEASDPSKAQVILNAQTFANSEGLGAVYRVGQKFYIEVNSRYWEQFNAMDFQLGKSDLPIFMMHEIGHGLGMKHPFDGAFLLPSNLNHRGYTVMSHNYNPDGTYRSDLSPLDKATLTYLYGSQADEEALSVRWSQLAGGGLVSTGNEEANQIRGVSDRDWIIAGAGNDTAVGQDGNDTIFGGTGNDSLDGGAMDDALSGGDGADVLIGGIGHDLMSGDDGNDSLGGGDGADTLWGARGADTLIGGAHDDLLGGGSENDILDGGAGNDSLFGGSGDDTLDGQDGDDLLVGGSDNDSLSAGAGQDTLLGGDGDDVLLDVTGADRMDGGRGNDSILGGAGNDTLLGGDGDDTMYGAQDHDLLLGQGGRDTLWGQIGDDTASGGDGDDYIDAGPGNDLLFADAGDDRLIGRAGDDIMYGGDGNDSLDGNVGDDILNGGSGINLIYGDEGNDTLIIDNLPPHESEYRIVFTNSISNTTSRTGILIVGDRIDYFTNIERFQFTDTIFADVNTEPRGRDFYEAFAARAYLIARGNEAPLVWLNDTVNALEAGATSLLDVAKAQIFNKEWKSGAGILEHDEMFATLWDRAFEGSTFSPDTLKAARVILTNPGQFIYELAIAPNPAEFMRAGLTMDYVSKAAPLTTTAAAPTVEEIGLSEFIGAGIPETADTATSAEKTYIETLAPGETIFGFKIIDERTILGQRTSQQITESKYVDGRILIQLYDGRHILVPDVDKIRLIDGTIDFRASSPTTFASRFYESLFREDVPAETLTKWAGLAASGGAKALISDIVQSAGFIEAFGAMAPDNFARVSYRAVLGREPSQAEIETVRVRLASGISKAEFVQDLALSDSALRRLGVTNEDGIFIEDGFDRWSQQVFDTVLNREVFSVTRDFYSSYLRSGVSVDWIVNAIGNSDEARARYTSMNNSDFAKSIFQNTFDHAPGEAHLALLVKQLDDGMSRLTFIRRMVGEVEELEAVPSALSSGSFAVSQDFAFARIVGSEGADLLIGRLWSDDIFGGNGNDVVAYDPADRLVNGGAGQDMLRLVATADVDLSLFNDQVAGGGIVINFESVDASRLGSAITLRGSEGSNHLIGGTNGDLLLGMGGNDVLWGGAGNDTLDGGGGADHLIGGGGNDRFIVTLGAVVIERPGDGSDTVVAVSGSSHTLSPNVEYLILDGSSLITGIGNNIANTIIGNAQANTLYGNRGNDILVGEGGNDIIVGGLGADTLTGGQGNDIFRFAMLDESTNQQRDFIVDFTYSAVDGIDRIDLRFIDTSPHQASDQAFLYVGAAGFSASGSAELRVVKMAANQYLAQGDVDGDGRADLEIQISSTYSPQAGWFLL